VKHDSSEAAGIIALARQLMRDARAWISAEIGFYQALIGDRMRDAKMAIAFAVLALVLANAALIALLIGGILILLPYVGAFWATLIVIGLTLAIAAILGLSALDHVKRALRSPTGGDR